MIKTKKLAGYSYDGLSSNKSLVTLIVTEDEFGKTIAFEADGKYIGIPVKEIENLGDSVKILF